MSKLKKFTDFFVSFEDEEGGVPEEAASDNPDVAAKAAADHAQSRQKQPVRKPVTVSDPYADDDFDIAALERELAAPAPRQSRPSRPARVAASDGSSSLFEPKAFDDIYAMNGIPIESSPDFTVFTIEQLLANPHLQNLPDSTKTASLMVALQARSVTVADVVEDARNRDHALDTHDADLLQRLIDLEDQVAAKNATAETKINELLDNLRTEIASNNERAAAAKAEYYEWKAGKVAEEQRLFNTISHLVEAGSSNPVSIDED